MYYFDRLAQMINYVPLERRTSTPAFEMRVLLQYDFKVEFL